MNIPEQYWARISLSIAEVAKHVQEGLCIRPKPFTFPIKLCVRKAAEDSLCCTRHKDDCPAK